MDDCEELIMDLTCEEEQKIDDDLDYALAYCLETDFEEDSVSDNASNKLEWNVKNKKKFKADKGQESDYMLALQLQAKFAEENRMKASILGSSSSGEQKSWNQGLNREDSDYMLALQLQAELSEEKVVKSGPHDVSNVKPKSFSQNVHLPKHGDKQPSSIVDPEWEVLDPIPNIHSLFIQFNHEFFWGQLQGVEVRWSPRMTLCAGVCSYEGRGGLCSVRLSQPLLKYRPRRDLVETLLHEMIHAYLFVTHNNKDHDAHGPEFLKHMDRINKRTGTRISVYHSFHDEVDLHRKHWWKCNGPCQRSSPFFGLVKRAMNRAPSPRDPWWARHQAVCGGTFIKIKEPESSSQKNNLKQKVTGNDSRQGGIQNYFHGNSISNKKNQSEGHSTSSVRQPGVPNVHTMVSANTNKGSQSQIEIPVRQPGVPNIHTVSSPGKCDKGVSSSSVLPFSGKGYLLGSSVPRNRTTGSHLGNGTNFSSRLVRNNLPKIPPIGSNSLSQKLDVKKPLNPAQRKSPASNGLKSKDPIISDTPSHSTKGNFGTAVKFPSSGSRTIVIPKNSKTTKTSVVENPSSLPEIPFKGEGFPLGGGSKFSQESESKFSNTMMPSTSNLQKESDLDDSFDSVFPKTPNNRGNINPVKKETPYSKPKNIFTQSKINFHSASPKEKSCNSSKPESGSSANSDSLVKCPVCGSVVRDSTINAHLDICLQTST